MKKYRLPQKFESFGCVILANGEFPFHPLALSVLENAEYIVCCDGAIDNLSNTHIKPDAIVGDCDSLSVENAERYADIICRVKEQDTNDQTKAVNYCLMQGRRKIVIVGATGKREDHTIGNISLLCEYMKDADVTMITNYGIFVAIDSDSVFESVIGQQVSLFCIDNCEVTTQNLLYGVNNRIFTNWWQATLNESLGDDFTIKTNGRVIVYRAF